jgi:hypothetical protein
VGAPQPGVLDGHGVGFGHFAEEGFHFSRRRKDHQDAPHPTPSIRPDMRDAARAEERVAGLKAHLFLPDLEQKLAFEDVEPFILLEMQVARGTAALVEDIFQDKQARGIRKRKLEINPTDAQAALFSKPVLPVKDQHLPRLSGLWNRKITHPAPHSTARQSQ